MLIRKSQYLIAILILLTSPLFAQSTARVERMWVAEGIHGHRVILQLSSPVRYAPLYIRRPPRIVIYLRDALLNVEQPVLTDRHSPVQGVVAEQWMDSPKIVKVSVDLTREFRYQILQEGSFLYIDLETSFGRPRPAQRIVPEGGMDGPTVSRSVVSGGIASLDPIVPFGVPPQEGSRTGGDSGPLITLEVNEADIGNVLRLLSRQSKLNIIASKDVVGQITVSLHGVALKEALETILKANGYTYLLDGEMILVKPEEKLSLVDKQTKVYHLRHIDAYNLKKVIEEATSEQTKITVFSRKFMADDEKAQQGRGQSDNQKRSSTLIVTDLPENIQRIDTIVEELDRAIPMVMIEAKLIELSPKHEGELGINWSKTLDARLSAFDEATTREFSARNEDVFRGAPWTFGTLTSSQFGAVLDFLRRETHSKLVSNPRILAMDNEESTITVGTTFPVPQITRGVGLQGDIVTFQDRNVDISLRVTPHIDMGSGTITMYVNPVIEEVTGEVVIDKNSAPITSKRTVESVVTVRDGETLVIGGLIKENDKQITEKVWLVGDLPLLGNFFRHKKKENTQSDLLIFITPRVVEGGS